MNLDLLRTFSLDAAERGEEIMLKNEAGMAIKFVAGGANKFCCIRYPDNYLGIAHSDFLRMKPLAWREDRPVYKGDVLYSPHQKLTVIKIDKDTGELRAQEITGTIPINSLTWTKPEPVKKTRTVKFLAWMSERGHLVWYADDTVWDNLRRVPSADVTYEVEQ